jgi:hypothetical protein
MAGPRELTNSNWCWTQFVRLFNSHLDPLDHLKRPTLDYSAHKPVSETEIG